ncbi:MAG: hypothetical protein NWE92_07905 [Candidatus Bathyarchaeota archaeon]|nr:hypothetical protein [Candidatus Bathyarchaeota archaeon]
MYEIPRFIVEIVSVIIYFILLYYMIKPYKLTKETRYLGLPLGFFFLGVSEIILASQIIYPITQLNGLSVTIRAFAFVFIALTYYFSNKPSKDSQLIWSATLSVTILSFTLVCLVLFVAPALNLLVPVSFSIFLRVLSLFCLAYICIHILRSQLDKTVPMTFWIPLGFFFLLISEYSQLIRMVDQNYAYGLAFVGGLVFRFLAFAVFLYVVTKNFIRPAKTENPP